MSNDENLQFDSAKLKYGNLSPPGSGRNSSPEVAYNESFEVLNKNEQEDSTINSEDKKPTAKKHNTRGQNGIKKRKIDDVSQDELQVEEDEDFLLHSCAFDLAFLDRRACGRILLQDANRLLEEILLPMSFPWTHHSAPLVRVPRDIEDMPGIVEIGYMDPENDELYGKLEPFRDKLHPTNTIAAARRCNDPGVIMLTTITELSKARLDSLSVPDSFHLSGSTLSVPGEVSLQVFQEVQARKRTKVAIEQSCTSIREISVKLASTSSRYNILDSVEDGRSTLILPVLLPREVQEGKRRSGDNAFEFARELGSYNCRQSQVQPSKDDNIRKRAWVGRSRLIWTEHDHVSLSAHKNAYRSILTGERLESNAHKRPLHVKLGVMVGGQLLTSDKTIIKKSLAGFDAALASSDPNTQFSYPMRLVSESLDRVVVDSIDTKDYSRCSLNCEKFFANIIEDVDADGKSLHLDKVLRPFCLKSDQEYGDEVELIVHPPRLDCTTTEDGIIHVSCTIPGYYKWHRHSATLQPSKAIERVILEKICTDLHICSICFKPKSGADRTCKSCKACEQLLIVKFKNSPTSESKADTITYDSLDSGSRHQCCAICMLDCGLLVRDEERNVMVHDVCRVWLGYGLDTDSRLYDQGQCHLCSAGSRDVIRCAATNCRVTFHPMCAILTSKTSQLQQNSLLSDPTDLDTFLCTQYEINMLQTSFRNYSGSRNDAVDRTTLVPVGFCGYHNLKREADHYGMYPGCAYLRNAMRIPPRRERAHE